MGETSEVSSLDATRFKLGSESDRAYRLKWEAWEWLHSEARCRCIGLEVKLQGPWGPVIDVVGVGPGNAIYVVEVKASRADFARDNHTQADIDRLRRRQAALKRRIELARAPGYRSGNGDSNRLEQEAGRLQERLATVSTKFHDPRFLSIADYHYIMSPGGVVLPEMIPPGWGLLEPGPTETATAPAKAIRKTTGIVANVLRAIARANTTTMMRAHGVEHGAGGVVFPRSANGAINLNTPYSLPERTVAERLPEEDQARNHH